MTMPLYRRVNGISTPMIDPGTGTSSTASAAFTTRRQSANSESGSRAAAGCDSMASCASARKAESVRACRCLPLETARIAPSMPAWITLPRTMRRASNWAGAALATSLRKN
jgi:hypothetical protein